MSRLLVVLVLVVTLTSAVRRNNKHCKKHLNVINYGLQDMYCDQPLFVTFLQRTDDNMLLDNVCHTYFPLPDDPTTFQFYISRVYCDGSHEIISFIATDMETGIQREGSPYCTFTDTIFGYAGCDTYLVYRCFEYGNCDSVQGTLVYGVSKSCKTIGLSCIRKVEEIVESNHIPNKDYYVLPMKLPNKCVTQQLCVAPANPLLDRITGHKSRHR